MSCPAEIGQMSSALLFAAAISNMVKLLTGTYDEGFLVCVAAVCHDFEHPGVNNDFLIKTANRMALMYNVSLLPIMNIMQGLPECAATGSMMQEDAQVQVWKLPKSRRPKQQPQCRLLKPNEQSGWNLMPSVQRVWQLSCIWPGKCDSAGHCTVQRAV